MKNNLCSVETTLTLMFFLSCTMDTLPSDSEQKIAQEKKLDKDTLLSHWLAKSDDEKGEAVKFWMKKRPVA